MAKIPGLKDAYALKGDDEVRALYADWATSYDSGFGDATGYQLPRAVALAFVSAGGTGPVLDFGAGTGLVAEHLAAHGVGPLDAVDLSAEMLAVAQSKALYRATYAQDVLSPGHDLRPGSYAGIVSAGTFTHGHVGPEGLAALLDLAAPGALVVVSVNAEHFTAAGFAAALNALEGAITDLTLAEVRIYDDRAEDAHRNDMAKILTLRKATVISR